VKNPSVSGSSPARSTKLKATDFEVSGFVLMAAYFVVIMKPQPKF